MPDQADNCGTDQELTNKGERYGCCFIDRCYSPFDCFCGTSLEINGKIETLDPVPGLMGDGVGKRVQQRMFEPAYTPS